MAWKKLEEHEFGEIARILIYNEYIHSDLYQHEVLFTNPHEML